jgi:hypothetical protein
VVVLVVIGFSLRIRFLDPLVLARVRSDRACFFSLPGHTGAADLD